MRGLTIVVSAPAAWPTALKLALAQVALGGRARLFLDGAAVAMVAPPAAEADLLAEAIAAGVAVTLCQTALAAAGLRADQLDGRLEYGGFVAMLAGLGDDRLVTF